MGWWVGGLVGWWAGGLVGWWVKLTCRAINSASWSSFPRSARLSERRRPRAADAERIPPGMAVVVGRVRSGATSDTRGLSFSDAVSPPPPPSAPPLPRPLSPAGTASAPLEPGVFVGAGTCAAAAVGALVSAAAASSVAVEVEIGVEAGSTGRLTGCRRVMGVNLPTPPPSPRPVPPIPPLFRPASGASLIPMGA